MTYRLPSLNTLRAFEASARHLSFKTAANELGVTPGAVSQQVKKLETSLGIALFRRLPHGLLLTTEGETYLPKVTQVFEDLTEATELIAPKINSKKFTIGICKQTAKLLPENWPKHSSTLQHYVRDIVHIADVELIRSDEIDCIIRSKGGPYGELTLVNIPCENRSDEENLKLHFVCKPGLADCLQTKAIIEDIINHLPS